MLHGPRAGCAGKISLEPYLMQLSLDLPRFTMFIWRPMREHLASHQHFFSQYPGYSQITSMGERLPH